MTRPAGESGRRTPAAADSRSIPAAGRWPEPTTPIGAVLYAVIAGVIVWLVITVLSHIQITWH